MVASWRGPAESAKAACLYAYTDAQGNHVADGFALGDDYYKQGIPHVEEYLIAGGVRMAAILNYELGAVTVM